MLWDVLPTGAQPGGAPLNVTYHLRKMGQVPAFITRVGDDENGRLLTHFLEQKNLSVEYVQVDRDVSTGIVHATPIGGEMSYQIVHPAAYDYISMDEKFDSLFTEDKCFVFGSLITRSKQSCDTLFSLLETPVKKIFDINIRPPFYEPHIVERLLHKADILKMNIHELELVAGWFGKYQTNTERINLLQDKFNIPFIIVTMGAQGAMMNIERSLHTHPGFKVNVADTVGSGDAFLAALLSSVMQNKSFDESLTFASALGALVASKAGGCPDYSVEEVKELIDGEFKTISY